MLTGVEANRIIVGAYTDRKGGVCRCSPRTATAAARASPASPRGSLHRRPRRPRPASDRELHTLTAMLEASIALDELPALEEVAREVKKLRAAASSTASTSTSAPWPSWV